MHDFQLAQIREAEKDSHIRIYTDAKLFEKGSWLQTPVKTVLDLLPLFQDYTELRVLDLGCGVGRNCIPIARACSSIPCKIECVDILELAIAKLLENAKQYDVESMIDGIVMPLEKYQISENSYDLILAVSALEHIDSKTSLTKKLAEISSGLRKNGVVCLIMNSNVTEVDKETKDHLPPQFEVNLPTDTLLELLEYSFSGWKTLKTTIAKQHYDIPRTNGISELTTNILTFAARKTV